MKTAKAAKTAVRTARTEKPRTPLAAIDPRDAESARTLGRVITVRPSHSGNHAATFNSAL